MTSLENEPASSDEIPAFDLYGEAATGGLGHCHIEMIETRSGPRDWRISAHLHRGLVQVLFLQTGVADVTVDGVERRLIGPAVITIPVAVVHGFHFETDSEGFVLTFREGLTSEAPLDLSVVFSALFSNVITLDLAPEPKAYGRLSALSREMLGLQLDNPVSGGGLSQQLMLYAILSSLEDVRQTSTRAARETTTGRKAWGRFHELVNEAYAAHKPVKFYADALNISESSLDRLAREMSGKSAFRLLQDRLVLEARRRLAYTRSSASEIAHGLGFSDLAYFSRFFKKETGQSPSAFRASLGDWR